MTDIAGVFYNIGAGVIIALLGIIGYFSKKTLDNVDALVKQFPTKVDMTSCENWRRQGECYSLLLAETQKQTGYIGQIAKDFQSNQELEALIDHKVKGILRKDKGRQG